MSFRILSLTLNSISLEEQSIFILSKLETKLLTSFVIRGRFFSTEISCGTVESFKVFVEKYFNVDAEFEALKFAVKFGDEFISRIYEELNGSVKK